MTCKPKYNYMYPGTLSLNFYGTKHQYKSYLINNDNCNVKYLLQFDELIKCSEG